MEELPLRVVKLLLGTDSFAGRTWGAAAVVAAIAADSEWPLSMHRESSSETDGSVQSPPAETGAAAAGRNRAPHGSAAETRRMSHPLSAATEKLVSVVIIDAQRGSSSIGVEIASAGVCGAGSGAWGSGSQQHALGMKQLPHREWKQASIKLKALESLPEKICAAMESFVSPFAAMHNACAMKFVAQIKPTDAPYSQGVVLAVNAPQNMLRNLITLLYSRPRSSADAVRNNARDEADKSSIIEEAIRISGAGNSVSISSSVSLYRKNIKHVLLQLNSYSKQIAQQHKSARRVPGQARDPRSRAAASDKISSSASTQPDDSSGIGGALTLFLYSIVDDSIDHFSCRAEDVLSAKAV